MFNFLGNPTIEEINDLEEYISKKYDYIELLIKSKETELNSLLSLAGIMCSSSI